MSNSLTALLAAADAKAEDLVESEDWYNFPKSALSEAFQQGAAWAAEQIRSASVIKAPTNPIDPDEDKTL